MPLEELEEKELARKNMIRPLIQERTTGQKKKRGRKADLYDWRDDQKTPWYPITKGNETKEEDGELSLKINIKWDFHRKI